MSFTESFARSFRSDPYLPVVAALILLMGLLGVSFSHSCESDGCMGIVFFIFASAALLALQLLICLPALLLRWRRRGEPVGAALTAWAVLSVACFGLPLLLVK